MGAGLDGMMEEESGEVGREGGKVGAMGEDGDESRMWG